MKFPTHSSGSSLDPVLSNLESSVVQCHPLGFVGSSDHVAVLAKVTFKRHREECTSRTVWWWDNTNWNNIRQTLLQVDWDTVLCGDVDQQTRQFTKVVLKTQSQWVTHTV